MDARTPIGCYAEMNDDFIITWEEWPYFSEIQFHESSLSKRAISNFYTLMHLILSVSKFGLGLVWSLCYFILVIVINIQCCRKMF